MRGPRPMVSANRRTSAAALGMAGLFVAVGGLLHPHVPTDLAAQMGVLAGDRRWLTSHWILTLGQALAIVGVHQLAGHLSSDRSQPVLEAGTVLVTTGLLVGTLGTLSAATGLPTAAETGPEELYETVNAFTLGLGYLCLVLTSAGGVLFGRAMTTLPEPRGASAIGWILLALSAPLLVSLAFLSPTHPWTHDVLLRVAAILTGILLVAMAAWLGLIVPGRPPGSQSPLEEG